MQPSSSEKLFIVLEVLYNKSEITPKDEPIYLHPKYDVENVPLDDVKRILKKLENDHKVIEILKLSPLFGDCVRNGIIARNVSAKDGFSNSEECIIKLSEKFEKFYNDTKPKQQTKNSPVGSSKKNKRIEIDKELGARERKTLLKIILGMAKAKYRYDPIATKSSAIKNIADSILREGIDITDDTIREKLDIAVAIVKAEEKEKTRS
jgi:hypothetical protein